MTFYIEQEGKIVLHDEDKTRLENTKLFMPQYAELEIQETDKEIITLDGLFVFKEDVIDELEQQEKQRIAKLTCTKRVFALMLQELGIDYVTVLKPLIESNPQAQLEWDLCVELERGNPLLDIMAAQLQVESEKLDLIFKLANKEITEEEFRAALIPSVPEEGEQQTETTPEEEQTEE